jgi:chromosomal replication initiator protein
VRMELTAEEAWSKILEGARAKLPEQSYRTWLAPTAGVALSGDTLVVAAASDFAIEWIEDKYGRLLGAVTRSVLGANYSLSFEVQAHRPTPTTFASISGGGLEEVAPTSETASRKERETGPALLGTLNPRYTLDTFVVGGNNELAAAACEAVAEAPGRAYNPLFIYGGVGLGKTHLMHAIGNAVLARLQRRRVAYLPTEQFTTELIAAIQSRTTADFHARYRRIDVLLVDDAHFLAGKEGTQEEFFHTFNALYDAQKQIVLTSDRPPKDIPKLQDRLVSRFEWGLVTDIRPPDFETRVAILRMKAVRDGLSIGDDVLAFIAERCRSSVRELEGAMIKLLAYSSLSRTALKREAAQGCRAQTGGNVLGEDALGPTIHTDRPPLRRARPLDRDPFSTQGRREDSLGARIPLPNRGNPCAPPLAPPRAPLRCGQVCGTDVDRNEPRWHLQHPPPGTRHPPQLTRQASTRCRATISPRSQRALAVTAQPLPTNPQPYYYY